MHDGYELRSTTDWIVHFLHFTDAGGCSETPERPRTSLTVPIRKCATSVLETFACSEKSSARALKYTYSRARFPMHNVMEKILSSHIFS